MTHRFKNKIKDSFSGLKRVRQCGYLIVTLILTVTACKSSKSVLTTTDIDRTTAQTYVKSIIKNTPLFNSFTSKMKLTLTLNGKVLSVGGTLKIKKNQAIQLSLIPLLGIEAGRIEITPRHILVLDRINKRYVQAPISLLKSLGNTDMDFYTLQSLFLNEIFIPGISSLSSQDASKFAVLQKTGQTVLQIKQTKNLSCDFLLSPISGQLDESIISAQNQFQLQWKYNDFVPLDGKGFPSYMNITVLNNKTKASAELNLSKMNTRQDWEALTSIPKKYEQMDINDLLKLLFK